MRLEETYFILCALQGREDCNVREIPFVRGSEMIVFAYLLEKSEDVSTQTSGLAISHMEIGKQSKW